MNNIAIFGASGAIGGAIASQLQQRHPQANLTLVSRSHINSPPSNAESLKIAAYDEKNIEGAVNKISLHGPVDMAICANGVLHSEDFLPEKSLKDLSSDKLMAVYHSNTVVPTLVAKYVLPALNRKQRSYFAALSARVGSISDNRLGGWYAYRASKAALNMMLKNAAIETARRNKQAVIVGLHPGTVDSALSKPFQANVKPEKLFTPDFSANKLVEVLEGLDASSSGKCFAWDGSEIAP